MGVYDDLRQEEPGRCAGHAREQRAIASYSLGQDIEARLARIETRLAYVDVSLHFMEVCRRYIETRLADAAENMAYANDVGLAFERIRRLHANDNRASSSDAGLLAQVNAVLEDIGARLAEIDAHQIDATLAHVDALLRDVGTSMEASNLLQRIPLPSVISGYASVAGQRRG